MFKRGREALASALCFGGVVGVLVLLDPRVHRAMGDLVDGGVTPWTHRLNTVAEAFWMALRTQSLENGPLLIFGVVSIVLFLFMLKT